MQILIIFFQVEDIDNDETACLIANLIYEVKFSITISLIFFSVLTVNTLHFWITVYFKFIHVWSTLYADHFRTKLRAISPISTRSWLSASRMLFLNSPQSCDVIKHAHDQVWTNHYTIWPDVLKLFWKILWNVWIKIWMLHSEMTEIFIWILDDLVGN